MYFTTAALSLLLATAAMASPLARRDDRDDKDPSTNIFPDFDRYSDWAICKGKITKNRFPNLQAPTDDGGCVRYYRGIDITGVVTEQHFYFKDGFTSACDCAAECLSQPAACTNWVWKHTFMPNFDSGKRSCTIYSSPNLPTNVTLAYDTANSKGFQLLQPGNNPQAGAPAPLTFLDLNNTMADNYGVSGFAVQDQNGRQFC